MKTFASYLADDITVFGTAVSEIFNNTKETLRFYKATADQLVGKAQFRSRSIKMRAVDKNILLNEQCDFYVLIEGKWMFYGHCRISSILKQTNSGWKLAHQHASFPDTRAEEGEQVAGEETEMTASGINGCIEVGHDGITVTRGKRTHKFKFAELYLTKFRRFGWQGFTVLRNHIGRTGWLKIISYRDRDYPLMLYFLAKDEQAFREIETEIDRRINEAHNP